MSLTRRDILLAWSLGNLCYLRYWYHATRFFDSHDSTRAIPLYGTLSVPPAAILSLLTTSLLTAGLIFLILWVGRKLATSRALLFSHLCLTPFLFLAANNLRLAIGDYRFSIGFLVGQVGYFFVGLGLLLGIAAAVYLLRRRPHLVLHLLRAPAILAAPFCLIFVAQGIYLLFHSNYRASLPPSGSGKGKVRVVVLLFDRVGTMELTASPLAALTQFKKEATEFINVYPPASYTAASIPSSLSGRQSISPLRRRGEMQFEYDGCDRQPGSWKEESSLFGKAKARNLSSKLIGWYLPYTTLIRNSATSVVRFPHYADVRHRFSESYWENLYFLSGELWVVTPNLVTYHIENFRQLDVLARNAVTDPAYDLVFIHYPIPHYPTIFDAAANKISDRMSSDAPIVNNLVLMDQVLENTLQQMRDAGVYDRTTILVTADHAVYEQAGPEDHQIPFVIKLPGQRSPARISETFNTLLMTDLIEAVLDEKITNPLTLERWTRAHVKDTRAANECFLGALEYARSLGLAHQRD